MTSLALPTAVPLLNMSAATQNGKDGTSSSSGAKSNLDETFISEIFSLLDDSLYDDYDPCNTFEQTILAFTGSVPNPLKDSKDYDYSPPQRISPSSSCSDIAIDAPSMMTDAQPHKIRFEMIKQEGYNSNDLTLPGTVVSSPDSVVLQSSEDDSSASTAPTKTTKKRRRSSLGSSGSEMDEEAKRERNRYHARKSRQRKKSLTDSLKNSLQQLKAENAKLRQEIYAVIGQKKSDSLLAKKLPSPTERFVNALKDPKNRVLDKNAIEFLQGLRAKVDCLPNDKSVHVIA